MTTESRQDPVIHGTDLISELCTQCTKNEDEKKNTKHCKLILYVHWGTGERAMIRFF